LYIFIVRVATVSSDNKRIWWWWCFCWVAW